MKMLKMLDKSLEIAVYAVYGKERLEQITDSQLSILSYETKYIKDKNGNVHRKIYKNNELCASYLYHNK